METSSERRVRTYILYQFILYSFIEAHVRFGGNTSISKQHDGYFHDMLTQLINLAKKTSTTDYIESVNNAKASARYRKFKAELKVLEMQCHMETTNATSTHLTPSQERIDAYTADITTAKNDEAAATSELDEIQKDATVPLETCTTFNEIMTQLVAVLKESLKRYCISSLRSSLNKSIERQDEMKLNLYQVQDKLVEIKTRGAPCATYLSLLQKRIDSYTTCLADASTDVCAARLKLSDFITKDKQNERHLTNIPDSDVTLKQIMTQLVNVFQESSTRNYIDVSLKHSVAKALDREDEMRKNLYKAEDKLFEKQDHGVTSAEYLTRLQERVDSYRTYLADATCSVADAKIELDAFVKSNEQNSIFIPIELDTSSMDIIKEFSTVLNESSIKDNIASFRSAVATAICRFDHMSLNLHAAEDKLNEAKARETIMSAAYLMLLQERIDSYVADVASATTDVAKAKLELSKCIKIDKRRKQRIQHNRIESDLTFNDIVTQLIAVMKQRTSNDYISSLRIAVSRSIGRQDRVRVNLYDTEDKLNEMKDDAGTIEEYMARLKERLAIHTTNLSNAKNDTAVTSLELEEFIKSEKRRKRRIANIPMESDATLFYITKQLIDEFNKSVTMDDISSIRFSLTSAADRQDRYRIYLHDSQDRLFKMRARETTSASALAAQQEAVDINSTDLSAVTASVAMARAELDESIKNEHELLYDKDKQEKKRRRISHAAAA